MATMRCSMSPVAQCASRSRQAIVVRAQSSSSRRDLLRAGLAASLALPFLKPNNAFALIPDEEDEDMLLKAKENRRARLAQQRAVTTDFIKTEGLSNARLEKELVPVQRAVYKLSKSGAQIESGDLQGAASTLKESWVAEFKTVATTVSGGDVAKQLTSAIESVQSAAGSGDATTTKRQYISLVSDLRAWATANGLANSLNGL